MWRDLTGCSVIAAALLSAAPAGAADTPAYYARSANVERTNNAAALRFCAADGSICVKGIQAAVQLEIHRTTIAAVLSALSTAYQISYRSSIALNEARDGFYVGSLGHVISRLLRGYNYVIKHGYSYLEVIIYAKSSSNGVIVDNNIKQAVVSTPNVTEFSQNPVRTPRQNARNR